FLRPHSHPFDSTAAASSAFAASPRHRGSQIRGGEAADREGESGQRGSRTSGGGLAMEHQPALDSALARIHDTGAPFPHACPPGSTT
ncbi:unnamed protein product, partial [Urochloa humidicola]